MVVAARRRRTPLVLQHSSSEVPEVRRQSTRLVGGTSPHDDVLMIWIPFQRVGIKQGKHQRSAYNQYRCTLNGPLAIRGAAHVVILRCGRTQPSVRKTL